MALDWPNRSKFSDALGFELMEREDGRAVMQVTVEERHCNTMGAAHGGLMTSVMDAVSGAAVARQPSIDGKAVSTVSVNVTFVGPSLLGDRLTVTAERKGKGKRLLTCDVEATNQDGEIVAIGIVTLRVRSSDGKFERRRAR
jgi:uncharacterized protein (TIGR00369 family)